MHANVINSSSQYVFIYIYLCEAPSMKTIRQLLLAMPLADTWDDAELFSVYRYVRGSKQLSVPESLKATLVG